MKQGETDPVARRVGPIRVIDSLGNPITGAFAGTAEIMVAGAAFGAASGSVVEIGSGYYYYQGALADSSTRPWVAVRLSGAFQTVVFREDVTIGPTSGTLAPGEIDPLLKRIGPLYALDVSGNAIATIVGVTVEVSINGAAWQAAAGTLAMASNGYPYYIAANAEVAAGGWLAVKLTGTAQEFVLREDVGASGVTTPQLTVLTTFVGLNFATARLTPFEASLADWPAGMTMAITVKYSERNEVLTARDNEGNWCWPFDVVENNIADTVSDPATLEILPRGGWPPCDVEVQVAAVIMAQE